MKASELRTGMAVNMENQVWLVVSYDFVKPGKGPAYSQVKLKNLLTGSHQEKRLRSTEDVDQVSLDRRPMEYLYSDNTGAVFMDNETYEQTNIDAAILGDALLYCKPNTTVNGLVYKGNVISVDLPPSVELEVKDTPPGIKDATKTNQLKEAKLETGLVAKVPAFIKIGEIIRISTETGEYLGRGGE